LKSYQLSNKNDINNFEDYKNKGFCNSDVYVDSYNISSPSSIRVMGKNNFYIGNSLEFEQLLLNDNITKRFLDFIYFNNLKIEYEKFIGDDDLRKIISILKIKSIFDKYEGLNFEKKENCFIMVIKENIDEFILNIESEKEGGIIYEMSLVLLMKIIVGSLREEKNCFISIMISAEVININGLDRLRMIFEKSTNNYNKLFISIILSKCLYNFHLSSRFRFIYDYLKNYLIFFYNQLKSSSLSSSSTPSPFLQSFPFYDFNPDGLGKSIDDYYYDKFKYEIKKYYYFISLLFSSVCNETLLFYTLSGFLSISLNSDNYERLIKCDSILIFPLLYFLSFGSNFRIIETVVSILFNIVKNEKMIGSKENEFVEVINKYMIENYLILMMKEETNNNVLVFCFKTLLLILQNSFEEIKVFTEFDFVEVVKKIIKSKIIHLADILNVEVKGKKDNFYEEVYFLQF
jgi:hypothetical protein